jgi:hypothetical protein
LSPQHFLIVRYYGGKPQNSLVTENRICIICLTKSSRRGGFEETIYPRHQFSWPLNSFHNGLPEMGRSEADKGQKQKSTVA